MIHFNKFRWNYNMYVVNVLLILLFSVEFLLYECQTNALGFEYHDEKELEFFLKNFTKTTKNIDTELYSIGKSAHKHVPLWAMKLSKANNSKKSIPNIKYVANIHGNEAVGRELLLHFMEYLRDSYENDYSVKCLLDNSHIHLLPCLNPDGFHAAAEGHCDGIRGKNNNGKAGDARDLNQNFPASNREHSNPIQPETKAVIKWMDEIPFILSAGFYGGTMGVHYPLRTVKIQKNTNQYQSSVPPDNDVFQHLASVYATNNPKMKNSLCEDDTPSRTMFKNKEIKEEGQGEMQYYNYEHGCMEVSLKISCCKYPQASELPNLWKQNKKALLEYALEALKGVTGQVLDSVSGKPIENATLKIAKRNMTFTSSRKGEFWRILLPGSYQIEVEAPGYQRIVEAFIVEETKNKCPQPTKLQILLSHISTTEETNKHHILQRIGRSKIPDGSVEKTATHAKILNQPSHHWPLSPKEEEKIFLMLFGPPRELEKTNITEKDIRDFMRNDLGINDTSKFNNILKDFDKKTDEEKLQIILNLGKNLEDIPEILTNVQILVKYIRRTLGIVDITPYEDILKDFDKLNAPDKKKALVKLLERFRKLSGNITQSSTEPVKGAGTIEPVKGPGTIEPVKGPISTASPFRPNSAQFLRANFSLEFVLFAVFLKYIL